jgi:hypothetical protein
MIRIIAYIKEQLLFDKWVIYLKTTLKTIATINSCNLFLENWITNQDADVDLYISSIAELSSLLQPHTHFLLYKTY